MGATYSLEEKIKLVNHLSGFATEQRIQLFDKVIKYRTRYITVVVEDIFQSHNASAVLRTCDCFGIQDIHIIENRNKFDVNPDIALGSAKWLTLHKYNNPVSNTWNTLNQLKEQGYRIAATTPHRDDFELAELNLDSKIAFVFGTEVNGLSDEASKAADLFVKIPMYGFTESFNISVSAAIILYHITEKMRRSGISWQLKDEETIDIKLTWLKNTIKSSDLIERRLFKNS